MSHLKKNIESMILDYETTHRTDYRKYKIQPKTTTFKKEPKIGARVKPPPLKDLHTLTDLKNPVIPFDVFGTFQRPKEILHTNPRDIQKPIRREDLESKEPTTRPHLVISPALCFEDIVDERIRKRIVDDFYTTTLMKASRAAAFIKLAVKSPFTGRPAPTNPITLKKVQLPYVPPEWRMESISWDQKQLRSYCDATMSFWMDRRSE